MFTFCLWLSTLQLCEQEAADFKNVVFVEKVKNKHFFFAAVKQSVSLYSNQIGLCISHTLFATCAQPLVIILNKRRDHKLTALNFTNS